MSVRDFASPLPLTFSETVLCQGFFPGNFIWCHSPMHAKLFFSPSTPRILLEALLEYICATYYVPATSSEEAKYVNLSYLPS